MQLTLFEPENKRFPKKTYHDEMGRFCSKDEAIRKRMRFLENEAEKWRRAYLIVTKRLIELERNANKR